MKPVRLTADSRLGRGPFRLGRTPPALLVPERFFFAAPSGALVATDALGAAIWEALPGTPAEIGRRLRERERPFDLSDKTVEGFCALMAAAEIAAVEKPESSGPPPPAASEPPPSSRRISAVIVTHDSSAHIRGCLASLRAQTLPPAEIIVVDNASSDDTVHIVRNEFPAAAVHPLRRNRWYPGGMNYGIERSAGEHILVLNDDVELEPDALAEMIRALDAAPKAAAVAPMLKFHHLRGFLNGLGNHVRPTGWGSDNFIGSVDVGQFAGPFEVPSVCVSAALLRREAFRDAGPFDASFRAFYEDPDWCFRARLRGWTIIAAPAAVVYHKFNAHWSGRSSRFRRAARNRLRFVIKNFSGRLTGAFLRSYIKEDFLTALSLLRRGNGLDAAAYIGAYLSLAVHLPVDFARRIRIQRRRASGASVEDILALNPFPWTCLDDQNRPRIDGGTYFYYYRRFFEPGAEENPGR